MPFGACCDFARDARGRVLNEVVNKMLIDRSRQILFGTSLALCLSQATAYPIDAYPETGIGRLEGFRLAQEGKVPGNRLPAGAQLKSADIRLRLTRRTDLQIPAADPDLTRKIVDMLGAEAKDYSISVLDLSDPDAPLFAEHNGGRLRNPGSVGKLMVGLALFQTLADLYPDDIEARKRVLHDSMVTVDSFIHKEHHQVPFWLPKENRLPRRILKEGDTANLWTFLDWMFSASSNGAATMVIKQLMLLRHFGTEYPVSPERAAVFFHDTRASELSELLIDALTTPVTRNGLDVERLRQGSFFSHNAKRAVPGTNSVATTHELIRYLVKLEQGQLVDAWSSLEIKRLIYMTQRRIRYAASPALNDAAVYFKSGSLYRCKPEEGFVCRKYEGNVENLMNSVAIVESPAGNPRLFYMVAITSDVKKKNSAAEHLALATRLHALLKGLRPASVAAE